jgi:hypothetical protein
VDLLNILQKLPQEAMEADVLFDTEAQKYPHHYVHVDIVSYDEKLFPHTGNILVLLEDHQHRWDY